ncbi:bifunctional [glutamine synthetase] adenylyltransferase/[glutamine synthetase]-adenylyl-L-tyrosine phosphorylase, partial [Rhizobium sp. BR5]
RDVAKVSADVLEMRNLIEQEKPPENIWDFKLINGGLVDLEFIAQYLALVGPVKGLAAHEPGRNTAEALQVLAAPVMEQQSFDDCMAAMGLYTEISQIVRLCIDGAFNPKEAPAGLIDLVCRAGDCPDIATLEGEVKRLAKTVRKAFVATVKNGG